MATPSSINVAPNGSDGVATVTQDQGAGNVYLQQIVIADPNVSGGVQAASVDAGGNLAVRTDRTDTCTPVQATLAASTEIVLANASRMALSLFNYGPGTIYIGLQTPAVASGQSGANNVWLVGPNAGWTMPVKWLGALYAISDDATTTYTIADFSP